MTPEDIAKLVDAEIARRNLDKTLDPPKPKWDAFLRHPMVLAAFTFLFTTFIVNTYNDSVAKREEAKARSDAAITELNTLAELIYRRVVTGNYLLDAVLRGSGDEARTFKAAYDQVSLEWDTKLVLNLRLLSGFLGNANEGTYYEEVVAGPMQLALNRIDDCLNAVFDAGRQADFPSALPPLSPEQQERCGDEKDWVKVTQALADSAATCTDAILRSMIPEIEARGNALRDGRTPPAYWEREPEIRAHLQEACKGLPPLDPA